MLRFGSIFMAFLYSLILKLYGLVYKYVYRENGSNFRIDHSQKNDDVFCKTLDFEKSKNNSNGKTEGSVFLQSGLISDTSKCQVMSGNNISGFFEEPKAVKFVVHEMFVVPTDVLLTRDQNLDSQIKDSLEQENLLEEREDSLERENLVEERESESPSFYFKLLNSSCSKDEEVYEEREMHHVEDEIVEDQECEITTKEILISDQKVEGNDCESWMSDFLEEIDHKNTEDLLGAVENSPKKDEESEEQNTIPSATNGPHLSDDEDDDGVDVLSEHQNLVQQMKMELKNCRIKGLPTISEESESPKMIEDLKPLEIDRKIEYKDLMEEIQMLYKSYSEKMRKLDILNYQTLHAISFLQLKDSEVFKKKADSIPSVLPRIWARKAQRIQPDQIHKSITEMHRDLELVYVGQLCLSWEILCWLYRKGRELIEYNLQGNCSYNRSAEDFQQFQVLIQRFIEDEQFKGHRNQSYVKNRCMIRSLLQVPTIRDDCKERREEADVISLQMLVEIVRESMLVFRDFLFADKKSINVVLLKGIKVDLQDRGESELLSDVVSSLQKKERRIREQKRSQNCVVKKMKRQLDVEISTCQVELRLVSRVLSMSRLTRDQLVWCKEKLNGISFVGRKVQMEPSFLLFPC